MQIHSIFLWYKCVYLKQLKTLNRILSTDLPTPSQSIRNVTIGLFTFPTMHLMNWGQNILFVNKLFHKLTEKSLSFFAQQGHDNFGHSIPELLDKNTSTSSAVNSTNSSSSTTLHPNYFTSQQEIMSPLPMHNRPLMGRKLGFSIDALIWVFCKFKRIFFYKNVILWTSWIFQEKKIFRGRFSSFLERMRILML